MNLFFLFLCLTLAASEGRVNGGEDFFQKVSVQSVFVSVFGLRSSPLSSVSLSRLRKQMSGAPPSHSQLQNQNKQKKRNDTDVESLRGSDPITQLTQHGLACVICHNTADHLYALKGEQG